MESEYQASSDSLSQGILVVNETETDGWEREKGRKAAETSGAGSERNRVMNMVT